MKGFKHCQFSNRLCDILGLKPLSKPVISSTNKSRCKGLSYCPS